MATLMILGCAGPGPDQGMNHLVRVAVSRDFQLRVGESARLDEPPLSLTLVSVAEDSRCPPRVNCIWAGNARVDLRVVSRQEPEQQVFLNTSLEPDSARVGTLLLRLVSLTAKPDPDTLPPNYVATLRLETGP